MSDGETNSARDQAVQDAVDELMSKATTVFDVDEKQSSATKELVMQKEEEEDEQKQRVGAVHQQPPGPLTATTATISTVRRPMSPCRSASEESDRSLRLMIAESVGGGSSEPCTPSPLAVVHQLVSTPKCPASVQAVVADLLNAAATSPAVANSLASGECSDAVQHSPSPKSEDAICPQMIPPISEATNPASVTVPASSDMTASAATMEVSPASTATTAVEASSTTIAPTPATAAPEVSPASTATTGAESSSATVATPATAAPEVGQASTATTGTESSSATVATQATAAPEVGPATTAIPATTAMEASLASSTVSASSAMPATTAANANISSSGSTIVTVSIAGKSAASLSAAAAAAAASASGAPPLALMRAPIQPSPVTRILPRPTNKKVPPNQQQQVQAVQQPLQSQGDKAKATAATTSSSATTTTGPAFKGTTNRTSTTSSGSTTTTVFAVTTPLMAGKKQQFNNTARNPVAIPSIAAATKFATVALQRNVVPDSGTGIAAGNAPPSSRLDIEDTVNKVAAGTQLSPPQQQQAQQPSLASSITIAAPVTTTSSSTATTVVVAQQPQENQKPQILVKPRPPLPTTTAGPKKQKKPPATKVTTTAIKTTPKVEDTGNRAASSCTVQQPQQTPTPLFPVPSNATATGMLFPTASNFALAAAAPNGGLLAYSNGGITQYFIKQTTSSGHQQLIPVVPAQQQFYFSSSPMPAAPTTAPTQNAMAVADPQGNGDEFAHQQQVRNVFYRTVATGGANEIHIPPMVSASGVPTNPNISTAPSSTTFSSLPAVQQHISVLPKIQQQQQHPKYIQPRPLASKATLGMGQKTGTDLGAQPMATPMVVLQQPQHGQPQQQMVTQPQHQQQQQPQYFFTPTGALVTLQPQQQQQPLPSVRLMPNTASTASEHLQQQHSTYLAAPIADQQQQQQYLQQPTANGVVVPISRPSGMLGGKSSSSPSKRKRKTDGTFESVMTSTSELDPLNQQIPMPVLNAAVIPPDEEENEPPPVLCRVVNRADESSERVQSSVESVFQREAKIIREHMFDAKGRKLGPLQHFIDGFEFEEDIEPFPCEHQPLLDQLRKEQAELEMNEGEKSNKLDKDGESTDKDPKDPKINGDNNNNNNVKTSRRGRKRAASTSSGGSSAASSPTRTTKKAADEPAAGAKNPAGATNAGELAANKKGRRRELESLLKMDFGKNTPFQTLDPDKYAQEVLIEARQQQRTLALAQEERISRRSVESSSSAGAASKSSKRDKHAKKPFSPPSTPINAISDSQQPLTAKKSLDTVETVKKEPQSAQSSAEKDRKKAAKRASKDEQRRSGESEDSEERCLYCRRSFKEVPKDKDHVQYCSKACRKQLKAAKKLKHSSSAEGADKLNSSTGDEPTSSTLRSDPSAMATDQSPSTATQPQQHITSPLGSAFAAMQPQQLSKRRLPVDQHAEQLMYMNQQRLSGGSSSAGFAGPPPPPSPFGQSPPGEPMLAVPMAMRPPLTYGVPASMYGLNASELYQQQQHQQAQQMQQQQMMFATTSVAGGPQQFFPMGQGAGVSAPGTPSPFMPSAQPPRSIGSGGVPCSSPAALTPAGLMERNAEIDALVARGVHTWTKEEVAKWVNFVTSSDTNGDRFVDEDVDGSSLMCLTLEQLKGELKFKLGPAIKLWNALELLKRSLMC